MASFFGNENLLAFKGAKLMTGLDEEHPQCLYVCIPVPYNDIQVSRDGRYANAAVFMAETNDKFRQACIQRRQQSGDPMEGYTPPSHQMEVSFSREFRERAMEAARKRILTEHPEWQTNPDLGNPEFNRDLKNLMYDAVRLRLGSMYARIRQQPAQGQPYGASPAAPSYAAAPAATAWAPPQTDPITGQPLADGQGGYQSEMDDLPF